MTAPVLPDAAVDRAGFLLAAADLLEQRAKAATPGQWESFCPGSEGFEVREVIPPTIRRRRLRIARVAYNEWEQDRANAEHIAAIANPAVGLALAALWRGIAGRHVRERGPFDVDLCAACGEVGGGYHFQRAKWPCPDLLAAVAVAQAYLTGAG